MQDFFNLNSRLDDLVRHHQARSIAATPNSSDEGWIKSQFGLAHYYTKQNQPELAIACCNAVLRVCERQQHPTLWAKAHWLIGNAYSVLTKDRIVNFKIAIDHLGFALEVYTEVDFPEECMETTLCLNEIHVLLVELREEESMQSVWGPVKAAPNDSLCFVMMPFSGVEMEGVYEQIIEPAVTSNGLNPKRADSFFTPTPIMPDVWHCITTAKVLIADLTNLNANVYYELGLCHALNKRPILMIQKGQELPFDLRHFRTIFYSTTLADLDKARLALDGFIKEALR